MEIDSGQLLFAFGLTLLAGLSTGIGSALAFYTKRTNHKFLSAALGFSAGVMIYVSMIEIFPKARVSLEGIYGARTGYWVTTLAFFAGIGVIALIDRFVPKGENPHEVRDVAEMAPEGELAAVSATVSAAAPVQTSNPSRWLAPARKARAEQSGPALLRMGLFSALAIGIHNFPEGIATFTSAIQDPALGASIAIAIAIHNIPEGIAVSVPVYFSTGSRRKAFIYSFLSGLSEPVGALAGWLLLSFLFSAAIFGIVFASVAGIMVYISLDELLPTAEKYGEHHVAIYGVLAGMVVMALSLLLFA